MSGRWVAMNHGLAQVGNQFLGFVTGLLIVRNLDKLDYAHYSIPVAIIAAATLLADSGVGAAVTSRAGVSRDDDVALSKLFSAAVRFRFRFGAWVVAGAGLWMMVLLVANGLPFAEALVYLLIVTTAFVPTFASGLLRIFHRAKANVRTLQRIDLTVAFVRLGLTGLAVAVGVVTPVLLLCITLVCALLTYSLARFAARRTLSLTEKGGPPPEEFWRNVRRVLPMTIALVLTEQALLAIVSFRGTPDLVAEMAALSRFAVIFTVMNAVVADVIAPRIASAPARRGPLAKTVVVVGSAYSALCAAVVAGVWVCAPLLLMLLGPQYQGLAVPLTLFAAGYAVAALAQALNLVSQSREWVSWSWIYVPLAVLWLSYSTFVAPMNSVFDAAILFVLQTVLALATQLTRVVAGLVRSPR